MPDSRTTLRYPIDLPARVKIAGSEVSCRIRNLSLGGVFIVGPIVTIGTKVVLKFSAPHIDAFESTCAARWSTDQGTGLSFGALRPADTEALMRFIRYASRPTSKLPTDAILRRPAGSDSSRGEL